MTEGENKDPVLPLVEKTIPCLKCGANTTHLLTPYPKGASWNCQACDQYVHAFSHGEMINTVMQQVYGLQHTPPTIDIPADLRVFLKHHGEDATEKEVSKQSVQEHVRLTGELPKVRKPLFAASFGVAHPGAAVPYGEVIRVENGSD